MRIVKALILGWFGKKAYDHFSSGREPAEASEPAEAKAAPAKRSRAKTAPHKRSAAKAA